MKKNTTLIFRVTGIIFFVISLLWVVDVLNTSITAFDYILNEENRVLIIYQLIISIIYITAFLFAIFSSGTAALFGGKNGFTQSVWNCSVYSLVTLSLYTSCRIMGGAEPDEQFFLVQSILMQLVFCIIILVCLREDDDFKWKNILPLDPNSKLCLKVYAIMLLILEVAAFVMVHIGDN